MKYYKLYLFIYQLFLFSSTIWIGWEFLLKIHVPFYYVILLQIVAQGMQNLGHNIFYDKNAKRKIENLLKALEEEK